MITFTRAYVANINGKEQVFASLKEAQAAELAVLFNDALKAPWTPMEIANHILEHADKLQAILTLSDSSRPRARGKSKPRKATTTPPELPLEKGKAA